MMLSLCICLTQCVERKQAIPWNTSLMVWASTQDQLGWKYFSVLQVDRGCLDPSCHWILHTLGSWMLLSHKLNTCPSWTLPSMELSVFRVGSRGQVQLFGSTSSNLVLWPELGRVWVFSDQMVTFLYRNTLTHPSWKKPCLCTISNIAASPSRWRLLHWCSVDIKYFISAILHSASNLIPNRHLFSP